MARRKSVRGFRSDPVPAEVLRRVFERAQRASSWCNIQPWRVWLTSGSARARLVAAMVAAAGSGAPHPELGFPMTYPEPYDRHRKDCGKALYGAMGIAKEDKAGRWDAWMKNFRAFDAPHVAVVGYDRRFGPYAALDVGCWLGSVMLLAEEEGLGVCAQAALASFPEATRAVLPIPDEIAIVFGISMGYEDPSVPANACRTMRDAVDVNVAFLSE